MARFNDEWVENKTIYNYISQSGCQCCGMSFTINLSELYSQCSDIEAANVGISSWPPYIIEQVWKDRVKFRRLLKEKNSYYNHIITNYGDELYNKWMTMNNEEKINICQINSKKLHEIINNDQFKFTNEYKLVLHTVLEQIQHFEQTKYPYDAPTIIELSFEKYLHEDNGIWNMKEEYWSDNEAQEYFIERIKQMGEPRLLSVPKQNKDDNNNNDDDDDNNNNNDMDEEAKQLNEEELPPRKVQSFKGDRRLLRIVIFRYFADQIIVKCLPNLQEEEEEQ